MSDTVNVGPVSWQCGICGAWVASGVHVCTNAPRSTSGARVDVVVQSPQSDICPTCHQPIPSGDRSTS